MKGLEKQGEPNFISKPKEKKMKKFMTFIVIMTMFALGTFIIVFGIATSVTLFAMGG
jgi:hypothetical protein